MVSVERAWAREDTMEFWVWLVCGLMLFFVGLFFLSIGLLMHDELWLYGGSIVLLIALIIYITKLPEKTPRNQEHEAQERLGRSGHMKELIGWVILTAMLGIPGIVLIVIGLIFNDTTLTIVGLPFIVLAVISAWRFINDDGPYASG